jgi:hypothetical protein
MEVSQMIQIRNLQPIARPLVAAAVALALIVGVARPAYADGAASTRNIILGAAAAVAGVILYNNIHKKQVAHNTVVGYTRDGGTVYADGRIVYPNGTVVYTANGSNQRCAWDGSQSYCPNNPAVYNPNYGYPNNGYGYQNTGYNQYNPNQNGRDRDDRDRDDRYNNGQNNNNYNNGQNNNNYNYANARGNRGNRTRYAQWNGNRGDNNQGDH